MSATVDYIFNDNSSELSLTDVGLVGQRSSILRCNRVTETSQDNFIASPTSWPVDHKAILAINQINTQNIVTTTTMTTP